MQTFRRLLQQQGDWRARPAASSPMAARTARLRSSVSRTRRLSPGSRRVRAATAPEAAPRPTGEEGSWLCLHIRGEAVAATPNRGDQLRLRRVAFDLAPQAPIWLSIVRSKTCAARPPVRSRSCSRLSTNRGRSRNTVSRRNSAVSARPRRHRPGSACRSASSVQRSKTSRRCPAWLPPRTSVRSLRRRIALTWASSSRGLKGLGR